MSHAQSMRDSFFDRLYEIARKDRTVILVSADMGAPSLDKFRRDLAPQFVNVGIAEANMITVAAGLALSGKKVFTYAIAPFATSRCHEFIKVDVSLMNLPVVILGVGAGFGYDDSGPTHHTTEDISIMRVLPNLQLLSPSDSRMAAAFADVAYKSGKPTYIRLDRHILPTLPREDLRFTAGCREIRKGQDTCLVATGNMVHRAMEVHEALRGAVGVIDLYRLKPLGKGLPDLLRKYRTIVSLEEHLLDGGLGSILAETIADSALTVRLKRIGLDRYLYEYGGRQNIQEVCGLDVGSICRIIRGK
jgi:transketolase